MIGQAQLLSYLLDPGATPVESRPGEPMVTDEWLRRHKRTSHWLHVASRIERRATSPADAPGLVSAIQDVLRSVADAAEAVAALGDDGIRSIVVKGPIASDLLFGEPAIRGAGDIDLVVAPADADRAEAILRGLGYRRSAQWTDLTGPAPVANPLGRALILRRGSSPPIDLHWRLYAPLFARPAALESLFERSTVVSVGGAELPTLCTDDHLRLLALHGIRHEFRRLKWLVDFGRVAAHLGRERQAQMAAEDGVLRSTEAGWEVLDVVTGARPAASVGSRARWTLAAIARPDTERARRGHGWVHQLSVSDRWPDRAKVLGRLGLRFVPGALPTAGLDRRRRLAPVTRATEAPTDA